MIDHSMQIWASRNADSREVWRDEDRAMAHQHWGPFETEDEARAELVQKMRNEVEWLIRVAGSSSALDRADQISLAAQHVAAEKLDVIRVAGLVWKISNYVH